MIMKLAAAFIGIAIAAVWPSSSEALSNFTVKINGAPVSIPAGATQVDVTGTYGCFTIAGLAGKPPLVKAIEGIQDRIYLENALFTTIAPTCNGDVEFFATFNNPPFASEVNVTFERRAGIGALKRGAAGAANSWFKVTGWIKDGGGADNEIATWQKKTATTTSFSFDFSKSEDWVPVSLQGARDMKAQFWFYLQDLAGAPPADTLELPLAQVQSSGGGGGKNDPSIANDETIEDGYDDCVKKCKPKMQSEMDCSQIKGGCSPTTKGGGTKDGRK